MIDYMLLEAVGVWVGALGQTATAIALISYTKKATESSARFLERSSRETAAFNERTARAIATRNFNEMINNFNMLLVSSEEVIKSASALRKPVQDPYTDAIIFSYLNCMVTYSSMHQEGLTTSGAEDAKLRNALKLLHNVDDAHLDTYLGRGYDEDFKKKIKALLKRKKELNP